MYTVITVTTLYAFFHCYILRQISVGRISARASDGFPTAMSPLAGYPIVVLIAMFIAVLCGGWFVPMVKVSQTFTLQPLGTQDAGPSVFVQARGTRLYPTTYLVRYQDEQGKVGFESLSMNGDVKIFEDVAADGRATMVKSHDERDTKARGYNWSLTMDDEVEAYEIHVPKGSVQVVIGSN